MDRDPKSSSLKRAEQDDVLRKFDIGVRPGVARALEQHRRAGRSIVVWRRKYRLDYPRADPTLS